MPGKLLFFCASFACMNLLLISGCGEKVTNPDEEAVALSGTVVIDGVSDPSQALVRLFEAPEDNQITQTLNSYPVVGFSQSTAMLFNPSNLEPIGTTNPNSNGEFYFDGLDHGTYIVDASLPDYACPSPALVHVSGNKDLGTLQLSEQQEVNGYIDDNVTWQTGEIYHVTTDLIVLEGYELFIEGGTLILLEDGCDIDVFGEIQVDGTPANPAVFRLTENGSGNSDDWGGIVIKPTSSPCEIVGAAFHDASTAIEIKGGNAEISECLIKESSDFGVYFEANASGYLRHSILVDGYTGITSRLSGPEFANNLILRMMGRGIVINDSSTADIKYNVILDCETGIFSDWHTESSIIHNLISGGEIGIHAEEGFYAEVLYNEIRGQSIKGIFFWVGFCYPEPFQYNNFIDMPWTIFYVFGGGSGWQADTIFARYNYWDGENILNIPNRIEDGNDHGTPENPIGPVIFDPPLSEPLAEAGP